VLLSQLEHERLAQALGHPPAQTAIRVEQQLTGEEIIELFRAGQVPVVVEDYVREPRIVSPNEYFAFWKDELKARLVEPDVHRFRLEDFPGERCYTAWLCQIDPGGDAAVLCKLHH